MKVALTVNDFLRRAELLYPDRTAIVDEVDQPAESWGSITYRDMAERARAIAAGLDALGIAQGERVAMVSHNSARLLTALFGVSGSGRILVPINFRLVAEEVKYIVEHSGARAPARRPGARRVARRRRVRADDGDRRRERRGADEVRRRAATVEGRRGRDRHDQLHVRHDRAAEGRAAHPSQHLAQRRGVRVADGRRATATRTSTRSPSSTATAGGCCTPSPGWAAST